METPDGRASESGGPMEIRVARQRIVQDIGALCRSLEEARQSGDTIAMARLAGKLEGLRQALSHVDLPSPAQSSSLDLVGKPRSPAGISCEQAMLTEELPQNMAEVLDGYFGSFFALMRQSLVSGGSEYGLGVTLFSLAVSIQAVEIIEIGRFKGFSTLALASALRFLDIGWQEPQQHKQRPDVDYAAFEQRKKRRLYSIDPYPAIEAVNVLRKAGLAEYVELIDRRSDEVNPRPSAFDVAFIDGDHSYEGCRADVARYLPSVRSGGYFVLHDYYGWYDALHRNNSPVKRVIDELVATAQFQHLLIDTGYQSFVIFRKRGSSD